jgi:DNA-binding response OmpR family regulator
MNGTDGKTTGRARVLVVDDEMPVAMMIVYLLTRAGCDAEAALNAEQALRRAHTEPFDLITLDIGMPGPDGFKLYLRLKEIPHLRETPVIFVSGQGTIEDQRRALDLGAADFIEKPFEARDFTSRILSCMNQTSCRRQIHITRRASTAYMDSAAPIES